ncbi:MAG: trigger factor [Candidatus Eisenbacteria bacterium]
MKSTVEEKGAWQKAIAITLEPEVVDARIDQMVSRYRKSAHFPGFRKGKAPAEMVRTAYWDRIEQDVLESLVPEAISDAINEHELKIATNPRVEDLHFHPGEELRFTAVVELWPELDPQGTDGIKVPEVIWQIDDEQIDEALASMQERGTTYEPVERPSAQNDVVEAWLQAADRSGKPLPTAKRQEMRLDAGGESLLPEFQTATIGIAEGERRVIEVSYPTDFQDRALAGQTRTFVLRAKKIYEKKVPTLDDAFAQGLGAPDLASLRAQIRSRMEEGEQEEAHKRTAEAIVDQILAQNAFDVPSGLVERSLSQGLARARKDDPQLDEENFRLSLTPRVVRMWKRRILLDSIARKEDLRVTDDELDTQLQEMAPAQDVARLRKRLQSSGELEGLRVELLDRKVLDALRSRASVETSQKARQRERQSNIILP